MPITRAEIYPGVQFPAEMNDVDLEVIILMNRQVEITLRRATSDAGAFSIALPTTSNRCCNLMAKG